MQKAVQIAYNDLFEKKCDYAKEAGFNYIAVNFYGMIGKSEEEWNKAVDRIIHVLEKDNLECVQTHPYYYDLRLSSEIIEQECECAIKNAIIASGRIGAKWCTLHPRSSVSSGFWVSKSFKDNKKTFEEYLDIAVKHKTGIAAENLAIFNDVIPAMPFYSSGYEELFELVDSFKDDNIGICWDTGHANLMHFNQADAIKFLGKKIKCTHIHNNYQKEDSHFPPDNGNIDWNDVMGAFASIGYDGPLTLEIHCKYPTEDFLKNFINHNYGCLECLENIAKGYRK